MNYHHSPLVSIHKLKKRCAVCGHKDNCAETRDGSRCYCRRWREAGRSDGHTGRDGGMLFILHETVTPPMPIKKVSPVVIDRVKCDLVYQSVLRSLTLFAPHRENLIGRGLDDLAIHRGRFKSTPTEEEAQRIVERLLAECDLLNIPGFYGDSSGWKMVKAPSGFFVPILDRQGLVQGLQIRRDILRHPKDPRYTWFSSNPDHFACGTSSGAPVHIQNPERMSTGKCIITEGALKAFIAAQYLSPDEGGLAAISGTSAFRENFGQQLRRVWSNLHTATIAFDRDWQSKKEVKGQLHRLMRSLKAGGFSSVMVRTWECEKGIDDYLTMEQAA